MLVFTPCVALFRRFPLCLTCPALATIFNIR